MPEPEVQTEHEQQSDGQAQNDEKQNNEEEDVLDENNFSNTQINQHRYNFIDLVEKPFCTEKDLQNFMESNQEWTQMKDYISTDLMK